MLRIMQYRVRRGDKVAREFYVFARVEIAIEAREIAAGDLQQQRMAAKKDVARGPEVDGNFINLSRAH